MSLHLKGYQNYAHQNWSPETKQYKHKYIKKEKRQEEKRRRK